MAGLRRTLAQGHRIPSPRAMRADDESSADVMKRTGVDLQGASYPRGEVITIPVAQDMDSLAQTGLLRGLQELLQ